MKKRIFGSIMAILVIAMMLAGCGGTTNKEDNNSTNDATINAPVIDENNKENTDAEIIEDDEIVSGDVIEDTTENGEDNKYDLSLSQTLVFPEGMNGQIENLVLANNPDYADKTITFTTDGVTGTLSMTAPTVIGKNVFLEYAANGAERINIFGEPSSYMIYLNVKTGTEEEFNAYFKDMQNLTREDLISDLGNLAAPDGIFEVEKGEDYVRTYAQYVPITKIPRPSIQLIIVSDETNCEYEIIITDISLSGTTIPEETRTEMMEILKTVEIVVE